MIVKQRRGQKPEGFDMRHPSVVASQGNPARGLDSRGDDEGSDTNQIIVYLWLHLLLIGFFRLFTFAGSDVKVSKEEKENGIVIVSSASMTQRSE